MKSKSHLLMPILLLLLGCGGDGKNRLSGAATFQGNPIPSGEIRLTPDVSKGHRGPAVLAKIEDGRYQTADDKGVVGGAYVVRVTGYGKAIESKDPTASDFGRKLFPAQRLYVELPNEDSEYDIAIE